MIPIQEDGDVDIHDVSVTKGSTAEPRLHSALNATCARLPSLVWYSMRDNVVHARAARLRETLVS